MKLPILFATVLAVASAQYSLFNQGRGQPIVRPTLPPQPSPFSVRPTPQPAGINRVVNNDQSANIIRYDNNIEPDGSFRYLFETDNGIAVQAEGTPRQFNTNPPVAPDVFQGSYAYTAPDGQPISISYIADENGYQPQGESIPTPPPIPDYIIRALEYIARNPSKQN